MASMRSSRGEAAWTRMVPGDAGIELVRLTSVERLASIHIVC